MKQRSSNHYISRLRGVTLVELLIVVAIIALIAAFAYPSYIRQAQKAGRSDATSTLLAIAAAQEKEFLKNNAFTDDLAVLGITSTEANKYKLSIELPDDGGFIAKAEPNDPENVSQVGDKKCAEFTIDHTGAKRSVGVGDFAGSTSGCW